MPERTTIDNQDGGNDVMMTHVTDLISLSPLNLSAVLECLRQRYEAEELYTHAGCVVVALNPFMNVPHLYSDDVISRIHHNDTVEQLEPHVYSVAEKAYTYLRRGVYNQSVIVSGESGAGKTVSARYLLKYLVTVSQLDHQACSKERGSLVERRILDSNPILEAFGNASTVRNENSSRFGKYIELQFDRSYRVVGATIKTFLLEKTRVVHQAEGEANFHIFYQLLQGARKDVEELCGSKLSRDLDVLFSLADEQYRNPATDLENYLELIEAFKDFGITQNELFQIYKVLVCLLLLCCVKFDSDSGAEFCDIAEECSDIHQRVSELLGLNSSQLETTLTYRQITATHARRKSVFKKPCTVQEAGLRRDCLVKIIYASLFDWLLNYINCHIEGGSYHASIGILDIYGFESFEKNSLEQLCINYANEKLQQHFVQHFLSKIQEEHVVEGLVWQETHFDDNKPCLQLLEGNPGIFSLLNEECHLNRMCDNQGLSDRLTDTLSSTHAHYKRYVKQFGFTVVHYAQPVTYLCEQLLDKNKDNVPEEIITLLRGSSEPFLSGLISESAHTSTPRGKTKKKTVLSKFKGSLDNLMTTLEDTEAHYIRCIKPNAQKRGRVFNDEAVLAQLQACGVVQTIAISKQAFPARIPYSDFVTRFGLLLRLDAKRRSLATTDNHDSLGFSGQEKRPKFEAEIEKTQNIENMSPHMKQRKSGKSKKIPPPTLTKPKLDSKLRLNSPRHGRKTPPGENNINGVGRGDWGLEGNESPRLSQNQEISPSIQPILQETSNTPVHLALDDDLAWLETDNEHLTPRRSHVTPRKRRKRADFTSEGHTQHLSGAILEVVRGYHGNSMSRDTMVNEFESSQFGRTKLFLTHQQIDILEQLKKEVTARCVCTIQRAWRTYCREKRMQAIITIQSAIRSWQCRKQIALRQQAAVILQHAFKNYIKSKKLRELQLENNHRHIVCLDSADLGAGKTSSSTDDSGKESQMTKKIPPPTMPKPKRHSPQVHAIPISGSIASKSNFLNNRTLVPFSPSPFVKEACARIAQAIRKGLAQKRIVQISGELVRVPYLESTASILSRRRMPRVALRFHTRANPLLECAHYISQREFSCSVSDCLPEYD